MTEMTHDDKLIALAAELREKHLRQLLKNKRCREKLKNDKVLLWEHVDQLLASEHPGAVAIPSVTPQMVAGDSRMKWTSCPLVLESPSATSEIDHEELW